MSAPTDLPPTSQRVLTPAEEQERAERRKRSQTGEASSGLWQRTTFRRAIIEGAIIFTFWRLLSLVSIDFWPAGLFPFVLLGLLTLRFLPPIWASMRIIATKREKMSRRFFVLAGILAVSCTAIDVVIALFIGEYAQPFGGPLYGPDIARFATNHHHLGIVTFILNILATGGFLLTYYVIGTVCTRLAQGGFLRFTMPTGDGRVTL